MINEKLNIPELRFPGFDGEWEKKKLGELSKINPTTIKLPDKFIYIDLESVTNGQLIKEEVVFKNDAPSRAQRVLERNDILFQMVRPYQKNNLYFDKNGNYVASTGYAQIKTEQSSQFLYQYLHLQKFVDEVIENCTGTSYPAINSKDLAKIRICYPSLPEQQKIASFFTAIDKKISQLKKKKTLLEQYKKGVMQKIFSQGIRFRDENGQEFPKWEKDLLGNLCEITTGNKDTQNRVENGKYPFFVRSQNIEQINSYSFDGEAILTSGDGVGVGKNFHYINGKFDFHQRVYCLRNFNHDISGKYIFYFFSVHFNKRVMRMSAKNSVDSVRRDMVFDMKIPLPKYLEQTKIANFLSAIDTKINQTQAQIENAERWKKGLLQKMFV